MPNRYREPSLWSRIQYWFEKSTVEEWATMVVIGATLFWVLVGVAMFIERALT